MIRAALSDWRQRPVVPVLVVAVLVRLAWAAYAAGAGPAFFASGDQHSYWSLGLSIAEGDGYTLPSSGGEPSAYYPVGFPLVLAALYWLSHSTPLPDGEVWITAGYHIVIGTVIVWLVHLIAKSVFDVRVALVAAWLVALFPNLVYSVATFSVELTFIAALLAALAIAVRSDWASGLPLSTRRLVLLGLLLGAAVLVRPFALPLLGGLALAVWQSSRRGREVLRSVAISGGVVLLVLTPWTIRNAVQLDAFVPISTNLGDTLCMDRTPDANGQFRFADEDGCADPSMAEVERNGTNATRALLFALGNPLKEAELIGLRTFRMMEHDHTSLEEIEANGSMRFTGTTAGTVLGRLADWWFYGVGILAIAGAWADRRRLWATPQRTLVLVTAGGLFMIPIGLWGNPRFHVPLLPFMAIGAAAFVTSWRRAGSSPAPE